MNYTNRIREVSPTLQITLYSMVGCISFLSNITFIYVIAFTNKMRTQSNYLLVNLAISDLLIICAGLPLTLANLSSDKPVTTGTLCQIQGFIILVLFLSSNFNLTYIAIHRYVLIVKNHLYAKLFTKKRMLMGTALTWLCAILISLPPIFGWGKQGYNFGRAHCMLVWGHSISYLLFVQVLAFTAPLMIIIYCYYKIVKHTNASRKRVKSNDKSHNLRKLREHRMSIMLIFVVICFFSVFLPYAILIFWEGFSGSLVGEVHSFISMLMAYSNSMIDFWIYAVLNQKFRQALIATIFRCVPKKEHSSYTASSGDSNSVPV